MNTLDKIEKANRQRNRISSFWKPVGAIVRAVDNWLYQSKVRKFERIEWNDARTARIINKYIHKWVYPYTAYAPDGKLYQSYLSLDIQNFHWNKVAPWDSLYFKKFSNGIFQEIANNYEISGTEKDVSKYGDTIYFWIKKP